MKNILLVEDEAITALSLKLGLEKRGYAVENPVATGEAAIKNIEDSPPDAIIMDIRLAGPLDGIETAKIILGKYSIPIIFTSGYNDVTILDRIKDLETEAYLHKPVSVNDICDVLDRIF